MEMPSKDTASSAPAKKKTEGSAAKDKVPSDNEEGRGHVIDESGGLKDVHVFEDLLQLTGTNGPWNIMIFLLIYLVGGCLCFQLITYEFIGATPDHWCRVEALLEANWTQHQILHFAIPQNNHSKFDRCHMYDYNYTYAAELGYDSAMENLALEIQRSNDDDVIPCYSRDFNRSQYQSTLVTEFDLVCERRALYSTTQAVTQLGSLIACMIVGQLNERFGRRPISVWLAVFSLITGFGCSASPSLEVYIVLKTIVSACIFMVNASVFLLLIELCSLKQRSSIGSFYTVSWAVGYILVPGIAYMIRPWRWLQAAYTLPVSLLLSYIWLLPESPRWLISKGRYDEALRIFSWAARMNKKALPPAENLLITMKRLTTLQDEGNQEKSCGNILKSVKEFFSLVIILEFRKRAVICAVCWFGASMIYYGIALGSSVLSADPYQFVFFGGLIELPSYILLWPCIAYLGRKLTLVTLYFICALVIAINSIVLFALPSAPVEVLIFLSLCGKLAITPAFHLLYIYTAELFPTRYRSIAFGEGNMIARIGSMASPYVIDLIGSVSSWGPSVIFAGVSVLAACLALILPETKDAVMNEAKTFEGGEMKNHRIDDCPKENDVSVNDV